MSTEKTILLHICCAPDASIPIPDLISEGWNVKGFFYGGNIHPYDEYIKRLEALNILINHTGIDCEILPYNPDEWLKKISGFENEPEGGKR
ncbi:MAG: epoxyqueuosine reductase QueH, partial [Synergistaceae bacterium]|nr:epoxyqueuosine reductase QueH [Synergistaceae bacterium]